MNAQDASDIVQMNSLSGEVPVANQGKKKNTLLWVVLGCVVIGVGLGVFVYQQSLSPAPKPSTTPRPSVTPTPIVVVPSPAPPDTNVVTGGNNTVTFPKKGKLRIFHTLNNVQLVLQLTINGSAKTITLPAKPISTTTLANFADSSFEVDAGSTATVKAFLNSTSGPQLKGWIPPMDDNNKKECGVAGGEIANNESQLAYIKTLLAGEAIFEYQCWEDDDDPGEYNDIYMVWSYAPSTPTVSPSPSSVASVSPSPSASAKASVSPSPSVKASVSPSPSVIAGGSVTPTPSSRAAMPDTSDGVPVTGVFEVTIGTVSVGLLLLALGLLGLLSL